MILDLTPNSSDNSKIIRLPPSYGRSWCLSPVHSEVGPPRHDGMARRPVATSNAARARRRVESRVGRGEASGVTSSGISVRGVVRTDEKVRASSSEPLRAHHQSGTDRAVVPGLPGGHAASQRDAVQRHIRVLVGRQFSKSLLAEGTKAQRRALRAVRENPEMSHGGQHDARE